MTYKHRISLSHCTAFVTNFTYHSDSFLIVITWEKEYVIGKRHCTGDIYLVILDTRIKGKDLIQVLHLWLCQRSVQYISMCVVVALCIEVCIAAYLISPLKIIAVKPAFSVVTKTVSTYYQCHLWTQIVSAYKPVIYYFLRKNTFSYPSSNMVTKCWNIKAFI